MLQSLAALARSTATHVAFAALVMGAWAVFANRAAGPEHALAAGAVQGLASGLITLGLKRFLEAAAGRLTGAWALVVPPGVSCSAILVLLFTAHTLAGTAHVWAVISLPWAVSTTYAWVYVWLITRPRAAVAA